MNNQRHEKSFLKFKLSFQYDSLRFFQYSQRRLMITQKKKVFIAGRT